MNFSSLLFNSGKTFGSFGSFSRSACMYELITAGRYFSFPRFSPRILSGELSLSLSLCFRSCGLYLGLSTCFWLCCIRDLISCLTLFLGVWQSTTFKPYLFFFPYVPHVGKLIRNPGCCLLQYGWEIKSTPAPASMWEPSLSYYPCLQYIAQLSFFPFVLKSWLECLPYCLQKSSII